MTVAVRDDYFESLKALVDVLLSAPAPDLYGMADAPEEKVCRYCGNTDRGDGAIEHMPALVPQLRPGADLVALGGGCWWLRAQRALDRVPGARR